MNDLDDLPVPRSKRGTRLIVGGVLSCAAALLLIVGVKTLSEGSGSGNTPHVEADNPRASQVIAPPSTNTVVAEPAPRHDDIPAPVERPAVAPPTPEPPAPAAERAAVQNPAAAKIPARKAVREVVRLPKAHPAPAPKKVAEPAAPKPVEAAKAPPTATFAPAEPPPQRPPQKPNKGVIVRDTPF